MERGGKSVQMSSKARVQRGMDGETRWVGVVFALHEADVHTPNGVAPTPPLSHLTARSHRAIWVRSWLGLSPPLVLHGHGFLLAQLCHQQLLPTQSLMLTAAAEPTAALLTYDCLSTQNQQRLNQIAEMS